jgi:hypothetical protein
LLKLYYKFNFATEPDKSYKDTYSEATHTTSFDVRDNNYLASEVEEILISYGLKKQRD